MAGDKKHFPKPWNRCLLASAESSRPHIYAMKLKSSITCFALFATVSKAFFSSNSAPFSLAMQNLRSLPQSARISNTSGMSMPPPEKCITGNRRSILVSGTHLGVKGDFIYGDLRTSFLKLSLGFDNMRIAKERSIALAALKKQYGLTVNNITFIPIAFNTTMRIVADSSREIPCATDIAFLGGWLAFGKNVSYGGEFAKSVIASGGEVNEKGRVVIPGESGVKYLYLVGRPGSRFIEKVTIAITRPITSRFGMWSLEGILTVVDKPSETGYATGTVMLTQKESGLESVITLSLMFPGSLKASDL